ncbi:unnamed protein product, partial [Thlaspi arvense]
KQHLKRYENHLSVGSWKFIKEFNVSNSIGQYKTTKHCYRISFVKDTIVSNSVTVSNSDFLDLVRDMHVSCTLWGNFADQIVEATSNNETEKLICLIRFGNIKEFRDIKSVSNAFDASLVIINPSGAQIDQFLDE